MTRSPRQMQMRQRVAYEQLKVQTCLHSITRHRKLQRKTQV